MREQIIADICVIGAGSAGLSVAAAASQLGARTVLIEAARMGGDCLNTGCVPSKSLLAAAKAVHGFGVAKRFGTGGGELKVDYKSVHQYVHGVIASIAPHDSEERFRSLGCMVLRESARFLDARTVETDSTQIKARRFVVATGSAASVPSINGIDTVKVFTNENIFDLTELPSHLVIIGGGPIGCEMAQAFRRLGSQVSVLEKDTILPKDDSEAVEVVRKALQEEGVKLFEHVNIKQVSKTKNGVSVTFDGADAAPIEGSHLFVAAGRKPNVEDLKLDCAGIQFDKRGIQVDLRLRTTNAHVYAAGDVAGGPQFTHVANYQAGIIIRNALFRLPAKVDLAALPWVTYTEPELAHVGLAEKDAHEQHGSGVQTLKVEFSKNDRARTEGQTRGFAKTITDRHGKILGATIVGTHAGEIIQTWGLAISSGLKIKSVASMISPYPTFGEINKQVAGNYYTPKLFSAWTRRLVRILGWFG